MATLPEPMIWFGKVITHENAANTVTAATGAAPILASQKMFTASYKFSNMKLAIEGKPISTTRRRINFSNPGGGLENSFAGPSSEVSRFIGLFREDSRVENIGKMKQKAHRIIFDGLDYTKLREVSE